MIRIIGGILVTVTVAGYVLIKHREKTANIFLVTLIGLLLLVSGYMTGYWTGIW